METEAPVNLTYTLVDAGGDEMGHNARLSWTYPEPSDLQYGWITLEYELQYRRIAESDNWKVVRVFLRRGSVCTTAKRKYTKYIDRN